MNVIINGDKREVPEETTIVSLMEKFGYKKDVGAVAVNMTFIPLDKYEKTVLQDGDSIEILAPVSGG